MTPKDNPHEHCIYHREFQNRIENLEEENRLMRIDISKLQNGTISTPVIVAFIGLAGTFLTVLGGIAGVLAQITAKAWGWI